MTHITIISERSVRKHEPVDAFEGDNHDYITTGGEFVSIFKSGQISNTEKKTCVATHARLFRKPREK